MLYIDDGIVRAQGKEEANRESKVVKDSLEAAGLVVNKEKSCWAPSQEVVWLGWGSSGPETCTVYSTPDSHGKICSKLRRM